MRTVIAAETGFCARAGIEMSPETGRTKPAVAQYPDDRRLRDRRSLPDGPGDDRAPHSNCPPGTRLADRPPDGLPPRPNDPDVQIAAIAAHQHGVVTRAQVLAGGVSQHALEHRLKRRRLQPLYRSVYRVGPVIGAREREMAAVLACGAGAVVSYRSAAFVWEMVTARDVTSRVDVSTVNRCRAPGSGVCVHRVTAMGADEVTRHDGLPVTTPARTLLDLARVAELRVLERALSLAGRNDLVDQVRLVALLEKHPRGRGTRTLRTVLGIGPELPALTRSEAEARFLALLRVARVREPEVNVVVRGFEVDCLWRAQRLAVEIDGFAFHAGREAFERDRRRDAALAAAGYRVMRVTWRQITREREALVATLVEALSRTESA